MLPVLEKDFKQALFEFNKKLLTLSSDSFITLMIDEFGKMFMREYGADAGFVQKQPERDDDNNGFPIVVCSEFGRGSHLTKDDVSSEVSETEIRKIVDCTIDNWNLITNHDSKYTEFLIYTYMYRKLFGRIKLVDKIVYPPLQLNEFEYVKFEDGLYYRYHGTAKTPIFRFLTLSISKSKSVPTDELKEFLEATPYGINTKVKEVLMACGFPNGLESLRETLMSYKDNIQRWKVIHVYDKILDINFIEKSLIKNATVYPGQCFISVDIENDYEMVVVY